MGRQAAGVARELLQGALSIDHIAEEHRQKIDHVIVTKTSPREAHCSLILLRTPCLRRCAVSGTTSPNHEGVAATDSEEVWIHTDPSAILIICASLKKDVWFVLLKEAHVYLCLLQVIVRCASRGNNIYINNNSLAVPSSGSNQFQLHPINADMSEVRISVP